MESHQENQRVEILLPTAEKDGILQHLAAHPSALYALLQGEMPDWLAQLLPSDSATVAAEGQQRTARDPWQELAEVGLPREAVLAAVFGQWAEASGHAPLPDEGPFGKPEERGRASVSASSEWLADAAQQGRLHEPGPELREVQVRLAPVPRAEAARPQEAGPWAQLLPRVPSAGQTVQQLREAAAQEAEALMQRLSLTPRQP